MLYGAKGAIWAPIKTDNAAGALPTYGDTISFNGTNEVAEALTMATGDAYGDNTQKISISEFTSGTLTVKLVELSADDTATILGVATDGEGGLNFEGESDPPYGGYGFVNNLLTTSGRKYKVVFFPRVQASVGTSNTYKTKEDSITLEYENLKYNIFQAAYGGYKITKDFDSEVDATAYLAGLFTGASTIPGKATA